jgi:hypothetical protein
MSRFTNEAGDNSGRKSPEIKRRRGRPLGFAADLAARTAGRRSKEAIKRDTNLKNRRARILGGDILKLSGTSLNKSVEMDALIKLDKAERDHLIERAAEWVSARAQTAGRRARWARGIATAIAGYLPPEMWNAAVSDLYGAGAANIAIELINKVGKSTKAEEQ